MLYTGAPDAAILDPALPRLLPPSLAADSGFDALAHAVEAYSSANRHEMVAALAAGAGRLIFSHLGASVAGSMAARAQVHLAATMAGATMRVGLGLCHAMAHQVTSALGVSHGRANAILMPHIIAFNAPAAGAIYRELARLLGIMTPSDHDWVEGLIVACRRLRTDIGIPSTLKAAGVARADLDAALSAMVEHALHDPNARTNPRAAGPDDVRAMYVRAWEGDT
jgi:acetaldehyde dehydrogenase/alcohol dehydrogenase